MTQSIEDFRKRFPVLAEKIYLNSCSQGALSQDVEESMLEYLRSWHKDGSPWEMWVDQYEAGRRQFAELIGAEPEEVALVASASAGVNALASALSFKQRNKVVLGEFEFPTMGHIWLAQRPRGADVIFVEAEKNRLRVEAYDALVDRNTLIVPLTHMCFMNGFRSPVAEITKIAHDRGALVLLDDYQDSGTRRIDVKAMQVDAYVSGTLKYLLGPPGLAFMYVNRSIAESLVPTVTGWFGQRNPFAFDVKLLDPAPGTRRFESGTPPIPTIYGAIAGVKLLQRFGLQNVADQIRLLTKALIRGALGLGIQIKTPLDSAGPLVVLLAKDADGLVRLLARNGVICSSRHDGLRISFHAYNTADDVEFVLRLLQQNLEMLVTAPAATVAENES
ncbi:MAG TPA: aminotransferase class V-fold PLP-dependent enzyme [Candidatus Acidoferrum sp.]|nr:aminotransferase class V-fold PLP-dependent enzyme [Candidatus Acidoferrum sp.]